MLCLLFVYVLICLLFRNISLLICALQTRKDLECSLAGSPLITFRLNYTKRSITLTPLLEQEMFTSPTASMPFPTLLRHRNAVSTTPKI